MTTQDFARFKKMEQKERFLKESIEFTIDQMKKENERLQEEIKQRKVWITDPQNSCSDAFNQGVVTSIESQVRINESRIYYLEQTLKLLGDM